MRVHRLDPSPALFTGGRAVHDALPAHVVTTVSTGTVEAAREAMRGGAIQHVVSGPRLLALLCTTRATILDLDADVDSATGGLREIGRFEGIRRFFGLSWPSAHAARVVVPSAHVRAALLPHLRLPADRVRVIPHPVDDAFTPAPDAAGPLHVLAGSFSDDTDLAPLARLLANRGAVLDVLGNVSGAHRTALRRHGVTFVEGPAATLAERRARLMRAHVVICTDASRGALALAVEANAVGRPVVAPKRGAMPETCADAAVLVEPGDLPSALERLLDDDTLQRLLIAAGLRNRERFRPERCARLLAELYAEIPTPAPARVPAMPERAQPRAAPPHRPRVLVLADTYLPGFRGGGPVRSISNLVEALGDEIDFRIVTRDRDKLEPAPYEPFGTDRWRQRGRGLVFYAGRFTPLWIRRVARAASPDVLYLNSLFSLKFSIVVMWMRRLGLVPRTPVVLAPRGELSDGALRIKRLRKRAYLTLARVLGLYADVTFQASTELERAQIARHFPGARIHVAADAPPAPAADLKPVADTAGPLRLVFISRIARMKNLDGALRILARVRRPVTFDIYGPKEDPAYWDECRALIDALPPHVRVTVHGELAPSAVQSTFARYDAFLFPTHGENFGHVLLESLLAGCPLVTSDRSPWLGLEAAYAGFNVPLEQPDRFAEVIDGLAQLGHDERRRLSDAARRFGERYLAGDASLSANRELFATAARSARRAA